MTKSASNCYTQSLLRNKKAVYQHGAF